MESRIKLLFMSRNIINIKCKTCWEIFLAKMVKFIPWKMFELQMKSYYPKSGKSRSLYPLSIILRVHLMQTCFLPQRP